MNKNRKIQRSKSTNFKSNSNIMAIIVVLISLLIVSLIVLMMTKFNSKDNGKINADNNISSSSTSISAINSSEDTSSKDSSSKDSSSKDTSSKDSSSKDTSSKDSSSKDTSSKDTSSKDTSSKDTSSKDTSSKDTSSKDSSSKDTSSKDSSSKDSSSKDDFKPSTNTGASYESKYPDMVGDGVTEKTDDSSKKMVYLTFDDGVSDNTNEILAILKKYNVKATFFVALHRKQPKLYKNIVDQGHQIALHTDTHDYKKIYASVDAFLDDFYNIFSYVKEQTGVSASLMRFPGGSVNSFNKGIKNDLLDEMLRRGFTYHDWNIDSYDSRRGTTSTDIVNAVKEQTSGRSKCVILMHDTNDKDKTVEALPKIIEHLQKEGYEFAKIDSSIRPFMFPR